MDQNKLALFGGKKVISRPFRRYNSIGKEEVHAAKKVVQSGNLSQFIGGNGPDFLGGPKVKQFEKKCANYFKVKHAITVNSWTSGLVTAIGALDIEPGDEIIVPTWTMCASATAILHWNAIPVFADIDPENFCISPSSIESNISPFTKAIMAVDIFGQSADMDQIMLIAKKHNLKVISDTAQSPGALYKNKLAGTLSHIGGYSLNYHKHIHTGEGGVLVTNDDNLANRMRLIRNHGEAAIQSSSKHKLNNIIGHNFRLGEIECAIGIEQIKKLNKIIKRRQEIAKKITLGLSGLDGIILPRIKKELTHVYYVYPMILDVKKLKISRSKIIKALEAEGLEGLNAGYANVHMLPIYQKKIAYGKNGFPWTSDICNRKMNYNKGICPISENLHDNTFLGFEMCLNEMTDNEINLMIRSFKKVWNNLDLLRKQV